MTVTAEKLGPDSTMRTVLNAYPWAQRALFRKYHIGGCSHCAFQPEETLAEVCRRHDDLAPEEVLRHIQESHEEDRRMLIAPQEAARLCREGESVRLLDIRTLEEWNAVHLADAVRLSQDTMQTILAQWPRDALLIIYDHLGQTSLDAATYFQGQGFTKVRCLAGGIDAWSREVDSSLRRYRMEPE